MTAVATTSRPRLHRPRQRRSAPRSASPRSSCACSRGSRWWRSASSASRPSPSSCWRASLVSPRIPSSPAWRRATTTSSATWASCSPRSASSRCLSGSRPTVSWASRGGSGPRGLSGPVLVGSEVVLGAVLGIVSAAVVLAMGAAVYGLSAPEDPLTCSGVVPRRARLLHRDRRRPRNAAPQRSRRQRRRQPAVHIDVPAGRRRTATGGHDLADAKDLRGAAP